ncbi:hypothetical protein QE381_002194 [Microbacterium sp. SORGH_AS 888]|nr:hypothetical protein [Microbacterium sp. SORGH_AS_0888]
MHRLCSRSVLATRRAVARGRAAGAVIVKIDDTDRRVDGGRGYIGSGNRESDFSGRGRFGGRLARTSPNPAGHPSAEALHVLLATRIPVLLSDGRDYFAQDPQDAIRGLLCAAIVCRLILRFVAPSPSLALAIEPSIELAAVECWHPTTPTAVTRMGPTGTRRTDHERMTECHYYTATRTHAITGRAATSSTSASMPTTSLPSVSPSSTSGSADSPASRTTSRGIRHNVLHASTCRARPNREAPPT